MHIHSAGPAPLLGGVPSSGAHVWLRVPSTHSAAAGGRSSGGGRIHPLVPAVLPAETAASGVGRRSVRRSDPQARASTRRSGAGLPLPPWPVPSLTLGGGEHRPKAVALAVLPHCRLQRGLGVGPTTWRRARVTVSMVTMVLLRTDPPPPCLAQRAPCRGGPAGSVSGSGGGGEAVTDGHCGCAPAPARDSACSLLASVLAASGRD